MCINVNISVRSVTETMMKEANSNEDETSNVPKKNIIYYSKNHKKNISGNIVRESRINQKGDSHTKREWVKTQQYNKRDKEQKIKPELIGSEIENDEPIINDTGENVKKNTEDGGGDIKEEQFLQQSKRLRCTICLLGCLTICGMRNTLVRKLAFSPPEIRGYVIKDDQFICNNSRNIEFDDIVKKHYLGVDYRLIKKNLNKIASVFIYRKPLDLEKQIILFSHGNSTDIGHMSIFFLNLVLYSNVNLIAYDYSGYGYSNKRPSEKNIYKNITIVYNYVINKLKISPHKIIIYGYSIGSACSCYLMSRKNIKLGGCILHSPLASGLRLLLHFENAKIPWFDVFKNVEMLQKINPIPIFLMHGKKDRLVPYAHSIYLKNTLTENFEKKKKNEKKEIKKEGKNAGNEQNDDHGQSYSLVNFWGVENADHNDIEEKNTITFYQKIKEFLAFCEEHKRNIKNEK